MANPNEPHDLPHDLPHDPSHDLPRRDFLRLAGLGAGAVIAGGVTATDALAQPTPPATSPRAGRARPPSPATAVGAGVWGTWIANHLPQTPAPTTIAVEDGRARPARGLIAAGVA